MRATRGGCGRDPPQSGVRSAHPIKITTVTEKVGDRKTAAAAVDAIIEAIQDAVANGDKVVIPGFGSFEAAHRPSREGRNPSTGESMTFEETWAPKFKAGATFKSQVAENRLAAAV